MQPVNIICHIVWPELPFPIDIQSATPYFRLYPAIFKKEKFHFCRISLIPESTHCLISQDGSLERSASLLPFRSAVPVMAGNATFQYNSAFYFLFLDPGDDKFKGITKLSLRPVFDPHLFHQRSICFLIHHLYLLYLLFLCMLFLCFFFVCFCYDRLIRPIHTGFCHTKVFLSHSFICFHETFLLHWQRSICTVCCASCSSHGTETDHKRCFVYYSFHCRCLPYSVPYVNVFIPRRTVTADGTHVGISLPAPVQINPPLSGSYNIVPINEKFSVSVNICLYSSSALSSRTNSFV